MSISYLEWDSKIMGIKCGAICGHDLWRIESLENEAIETGYQHLRVKIDDTYHQQVTAVAKSRRPWVYVGSVINYEHHDAPPSNPPNLDILRHGDKAEIAKWHDALYSHSKYYRDPALSKYAPFIYRAWAENNFGGRAQNYAVRGDVGEVLGYVSIIKNRIDLLAVHPLTRLRGIGRKLVDGALAKIEPQMTPAVSTETNNQAANYLYSSRGFRPVSVTQNWHWSVKDGSIS